MRRLALLLGLLALHQTHCFEFVVEGEWETETSLDEQHGRFKRAILTSEEQEDFENIFNSLGHGFYKVSKAFHREAGPC